MQTLQVKRQIESLIGFPLTQSLTLCWVFRCNQVQSLKPLLTTKNCLELSSKQESVGLAVMGAFVGF